MAPNFPSKLDTVAITPAKDDLRLLNNELGKFLSATIADKADVMVLVTEDKT